MVPLQKLWEWMRMADPPVTYCAAAFTVFVLERLGRWTSANSSIGTRTSAAVRKGKHRTRHATSV